MLESIWITFCKGFGSQALWRQAAVGRCGCSFFEASSWSTCFSLSRLISLQVKYKADLEDCHSAVHRVCDMQFYGSLTTGLCLRSKSEHLPGCPPLHIAVLVLLQPWFLVPAAFATLICPTPHVFPQPFSVTVSQKTACSSPPAWESKGILYSMLLSCFSKTSSALPYSYKESYSFFLWITSAGFTSFCGQYDMRFWLKWDFFLSNFPILLWHPT